MFTDRFRSDIIMDYLSTETLQDKQYRLNTLAGLTYMGDILDTNLIFDTTKSNRTFYVTRLPELSFRSHVFSVGPFKSKVSLGAGNFKEMPTGNSALRSDLNFSVLNKIFPLGNSGSFAVAGGYRQFAYGSGEKKYLIKTRAALEGKLGGSFRLIASHYYQDTNGFSPLMMDYFDKYNMLGTTVEFHEKDRLRLQLTGGYNMDLKKYQAFIPRLEVSPSKKFRFLIGSTYDYNNKQWMNIDGEMGVQLSKNLVFKFWGLYDFINKKMNYQNYVVELDSHDFITRFVYKGSQGEMWLNVSLKLMNPTRPEVGPNRTKPIINEDMYDGAPFSQTEEDLISEDRM